MTERLVLLTAPQPILLPLVQELRTHRRALARQGVNVASTLRRRRLLRPSGSTTVLVGSDATTGMLGEESGISTLLDTASTMRARPTVLAIVPDQLDLLNRRYCDQVLRLRTSVSFDEFVRNVRDDDTLHPDRLYAHLWDSGIDFVPVASVGVPPWTSLLDSLHLSSPTGLDPAAVGQVPGPTLVAATRLLHKRLWRHGMMQRLDASRLHGLGRSLQHHAQTAGWDDVPFWGWHEDLASETRTLLTGDNDEFAQRAWGYPWPIPPQHPRRTVSFASADPAVVADVVETVQSLVNTAISRGQPPLVRARRWLGRLATTVRGVNR